MLRPDVVRGVAPVPDDYGWRANGDITSLTMLISVRVTDYPGRSYLFARSVVHIVPSEGRLSGTYKAFFISVKTLINESKFVLI